MKEMRTASPIWPFGLRVKTRAFPETGACRWTYRWASGRRNPRQRRLVGVKRGSRHGDLRQFPVLMAGLEDGAQFALRLDASCD